MNPKTLDDGIRQFAASKKATLGPLQSVTVGGHPGREFEMTEGTKRSKFLFVASGSTLFVLSASGMPGAGVPAATDKFLRSLEIGPPKAARRPGRRRPAPGPRSPGPSPTRGRPNGRGLRPGPRAEAELARAKAEAELTRVKVRGRDWRR